MGEFGVWICLLFAFWGRGFRSGGVLFGTAVPQDDALKVGAAHGPRHPFMFLILFGASATQVRVLVRRYVFYFFSFFLSLVLSGAGETQIFPSLGFRCVLAVRVLSWFWVVSAVLSTVCGC